MSIPRTPLDVHTLKCFLCFTDSVGLKMEGLFRVPGPAAYTDDLRKAFEEGMGLSLSASQVP